MHQLLAASVAAVTAATFSTASPTRSPEWRLPLAIPHVDVGWATFWLTALALAIATAAAIFTLQSLCLLLRKPTVAMGLWGAGRGKLGAPFSVTPESVENHGERVYHFEVPLQNTGKVQADNYRLSVFVRAGDYLRVDNRKCYTAFDIMRVGQGEFTGNTEDSLLEAYYEARTLPTSLKSPIVVCQLTVIHNSSNDETSAVKFRFSADGGYYVEAEQVITFLSSQVSTSQ